MIPLEDLHPQEIDIPVTLAGGQKITLTLRAYKLSDHVWFQKHFSSEEAAVSIAAMHIEPIARIVWHMLSSESKKLFDSIVYRQYDEELGEEVDVELHGYEKIIHAFDTEEPFWLLWDGFIRCKGMNGFLDDPDKVGVKKKATKRPRPKSIGQVPLIQWLRNMGTRRRKSSTSRLGNFSY